jgi:uncharacterized protein YigA (DUF484 family)
MATKEQKDEISWEEAVARFLEDNPDFLQRNPELLARLDIPHGVAGGAVSLIERQVGVLRERQHALQRQLRELISNARENDIISSRLHDYARAMLRAGDLDEVLDETRALVRDKFRLDAVAIRIRHDANGGRRPELVAPEDGVLQALRAVMTDDRPRCGVALADELKRDLFGDNATDIQSIGILPVDEDGVAGFIILGSQDPHRFESGMATDYLSRLGALFASAASRYR